MGSPVAPAGIPAAPGVYLFRGADDEVLYVGKAADLRRRVRSYFRGRDGGGARTAAMLRRARRLEVIVLGSGREALIREAALIRTHQPRYNLRLRGGRGYPYLRVTVDPIAEVSFGAAGGAACFGPFPDSGAIRVALQVVRRLYTAGPTAWRDPRVMRARERQMALEVLALVQERGSRVWRRLDAAIAAASTALDFERAGRLRDARSALRLLRGAPRIEPGGEVPCPAGVRLTFVLGDQPVSPARDQTSMCTPSARRPTSR